MDDSTHERTPTAVAWEFGPFQLEPALHRLSRGDEVVSLTPKVFQTLLVLLEHRNRVLSKGELMQAVWPDSFVSEESLTQSIWALRRALGDDSSQPQFISTIPKRGYRFIAPVTVVAAQSETAAPTIEPITTTADVGLPQSTSSDSAAVTPPTLEAEPVAARVSIQYVRFGMATVMLGLIAGLGIGWSVLGNRPSTGSPMTPLVKFTVTAPAGRRIVSGGVVSPNGRHLAYVARDVIEGTSRLLVVELSSAATRTIDGTNGASNPFWSPDSRFLGFFVGDTVAKLDVERGGPPEVIDTVSHWPESGSWGKGETLLLADRYSGLYTLAVGEGGATKLQPAVTPSDVVFRWPQFLPDGKHFLYYSVSDDPATAGTFIGSIGSAERVRLFDPSHWAVTFASPDRLLFVRDHTLLTQRFDVGSLQLLGTAVPIPGAPQVGKGYETSVSVSDNGILAIRAANALEHLTWFDRSGRELGPAAGSGGFHNPTLSPDRASVLVDSGSEGVWLLDLDRGSSTEVVPDGKVAVWSPDGERIAFTAGRGDGIEKIYTRPIRRPGEDTLLISNGDSNAIRVRLDDWSRDGRYIVYLAIDRKTLSDLWVFPTFRDQKPWPLLRTAAREMQGRISPDGRWIAYSSDESGAWEVYLQSFPVVGWKRRVSTHGGAQPHWRADGRELFYLASNHTLTAVTTTLRNEELQLGAPNALFEVRMPQEPETIRNHYAVSEDGQRFLIDAAKSGLKTEPISLIADWRNLLEQ